MRTDLDHLPAAKQRELERVVRILFEEFGDATAIATSDWKKQARILKVILYGSYARGGWVDEPHTAKGYQSDYDLLVIVNHERLTDRVEYWSTAEDRLNRELAITRTLRTPVNFIVHTLGEVNAGLSEGRYFFIDIARDGVALYQSDDTDLPEPQPKTPDQALAMTREYLEEWLPSARQFFRHYQVAVDDGASKVAAFQLHQSAERYYHCVLLVCTFYTPHVHNRLLAHPGRADRPASDRRLAARDQGRPRAVRKAQGSLCEGALLEALSHHRGGAGVARRAHRSARPSSRDRLRRAYRGAGEQRRCVILTLIGLAGCR